MKTKKKTTEEIITSILTKYKKPRENDILLMVKYCEATGRSTDLRVLVNEKGNIPETVRRTRQYVQSKRKDLLPSEDVLKARAKKRLRMRAAFSKY